MNEEEEKVSEKKQQDRSKVVEHWLTSVEQRPNVVWTAQQMSGCLYFTRVTVDDYDSILGLRVGRLRSKTGGLAEFIYIVKCRSYPRVLLAAEVNERSAMFMLTVSDPQIDELVGTEQAMSAVQILAAGATRLRLMLESIDGRLELARRLNYRATTSVIIPYPGSANAVVLSAATNCLLG